MTTIFFKLKRLNFFNKSKTSFWQTFWTQENCGYVTELRNCVAQQASWWQAGPNSIILTPKTLTLLLFWYWLNCQCPKWQWLSWFFQHMRMFQLRNSRHVFAHLWKSLHQRKMGWRRQRKNLSGNFLAKQDLVKLSQVQKRDCNNSEGSLSSSLNYWKLDGWGLVQHANDFILRVS